MNRTKLSFRVLIFLLLALSSAKATTLYWSGGGVNVGGGGTWNTTSAHFGTSTSGPFSLVWTNADTNDVVFTTNGVAPGGVVLIGSAITVRGTLEWDQTPGTFPNYTFNGTSTTTFNPGSAI